MAFRITRLTGNKEPSPVLVFADGSKVPAGRNRDARVRPPQNFPHAIRRYVRF